MDDRLTDVRDSIGRAVGFLEHAQLPHGEFRIWAASDRALRRDCRLDSTPSVAAFVAYAARFIDDPRMARIRGRVVDFLVSEMQGPGLWAFWTTRVRRTIAPDVDDTAWVSYELRRHHPHIFFGRNVPALLANRDEQGRFRTFFRMPGEANDVDAVVNASALFYLGERPETRAACDFLNAVIVGDAEQGSYAYYADHLALYYSASRAYFAGVSGLERSRGAMIEKVAARMSADGGFGDELATAFGVCTLLNVGFDDMTVVDRAIDTLVDRQCPDGSWARSAVFAGPEPPEPASIWWGSEEFTTAICLEALARHAAAKEAT
jgi:hypothetical protein